MKLREPTDDQGLPLPPFERPIEVWRALRAPATLYDVDLAAAAEVAEHGAILQPGEAGYPGPSIFYARRYWRQARPAFLAEHGQLTAAEARLLARRPRPQ